MNNPQTPASKASAQPSAEVESSSDGDEEQAGPPDDELVILCQKGDTQAFDELVTRYRGKVYGMIYNMVKSEADAWDLGAGSLY